MSKVIDLDILRPEPQIVKIGGKEIDVSFIPCGVTFDIYPIAQELGTISADAENDQDALRRAFDLGVALCAVFCKYQYPELNEEWFKYNATVQQIEAFSQAISSALVRTNEGIKRQSKN